MYLPECFGGDAAAAATRSSRIHHGCHPRATKRFRTQGETLELVLVDVLKDAGSPMALSRLGLPCAPGVGDGKPDVDRLSYYDQNSVAFEVAHNSTRPSPLTMSVQVAQS